MNRKSRWLRLRRALLVVCTAVLAGHLYAGSALAIEIYLEGDSLVISYTDICHQSVYGTYCRHGSTPPGSYWIIRPRLEGQPDENQYELDRGETFRIRNVTPGQTYIVGYKACYHYGFSVGCEPNWSEKRWYVVHLASDLQVSEDSGWSGDIYVARAVLTWQPARGASYVKVHSDRHRVRQSVLSWEETLPPGASRFEVAVLPLERWDFSLSTYGTNGAQVGKTLYARVDIALPAPKSPARPLASMFGTDQVRLVWRGDNVTQFYELERLQWPSGAGRLDRQSTKVIQEAGGPAQGPFAGGITGGGKIGSAPATISGGQSSPAPIPPVSTGASPQWVKVLKVDKVGSDTREQIALHRITEISAALGGSIYEPYTYRVCAVNQTGRMCSDSVEIKRPVAQLEFPSKNLANVFRILSISPTRFAKANANPPMIEVFLTYSGSDPRGDWAYRTDGGAWVTVRRPPMILKRGTAQVTIPTSVFQNSARSVDVLLNNDQTQAFGTIAVVNVDPTVQGKEVKGLQTNLDKQSPAPSREAPRVPDAAPKSIPPLQQQAPGKSTGSVFQR